MKTEEFAKEALARLENGERWEDIVDDTASRLGKSDNLDELHLSCLNYIKIKHDGKLICSYYRTEFFQNPPTLEISKIRDILKIIGLELIPRRDFRSSPSVTIKTSEEARLIQVEQGFWSKWLIWSGILYGSINESGNFGDRGADIILDVPCSSR